MKIPDDVTDCLKADLAETDYARILAIAPADGLSVLESIVPLAGSFTLGPDFDPRSALAGTGRFDLAVVLDAPAVLDTGPIRQLLARLRNYHAPSVLAAFAINEAGTASPWSVAEFLGLGFRRLPASRRIQSNYWIYRYDIHDYKYTPDWLNSRHWANPEQWNRNRW